MDEKHCTGHTGKKKSISPMEKAASLYSYREYCKKCNKITTVIRKVAKNYRYEKNLSLNIKAKLKPIWKYTVDWGNNDIVDNYDNNYHNYPNVKFGRIYQYQYVPLLNLLGE